MKIALLACLLASALGTCAEGTRAATVIRTQDGITLKYHRGETDQNAQGHIWASLAHLEAGIRLDTRRPHLLVAASDAVADALNLVKLSGEMDSFTRYTYLSTSDARLPDPGNLVEVDRTKRAEGLWELTPKAPLKMGEYALCGLALTRGPARNPRGESSHPSGYHVADGAQAFYQAIGGDFWDFSVE